MARPREFDNDKVLDALRDVFWEHGYEGTSYADIMQATGLQKGSLYAAFGDKRSLYLEALSRYDSQQVHTGVDMLQDEAIPGRKRLALLMQTAVDAAETRHGRWGCLLCNAAIEQAPIDKKTETRVKNSMDRLQAGIETALKALPDYARAPRKRAHKAAAILAGYFGLRVLVKAGMAQDAVASAAQDILAF